MLEAFQPALLGYHLRGSVKYKERLSFVMAILCEDFLESEDVEDTRAENDNGIKTSSKGRHIFSIQGEGMLSNEIR